MRKNGAVPSRSTNPGRQSGPLALPATVPVGDGGLLAAIVIGGMAGTLLRLGLSELLADTRGHWAWGTLIANVAGALILGIVLTRFHSRSAGPSRMRALLGTGFCGGLTTFSTFQLELLDALDGGQASLAAGYAVVSIAAGLVGVAIGLRISSARGTQ